MAALISVIIPCYGVEKYLDRCLESVVNQTFHDLEIILIDDFSPDNVHEICDNWQLRDSRVKVIHKKTNEGLGFARNSGLDIASGEYVAFVDSDDFVELDMFERLYAEATQYNADVVYSGFFVENTPGVWKKTTDVENHTVWCCDEVTSFMKDMIACEPYDSRVSAYQMSVWHSIYKRRIIEVNHLRFHSERECLSEDLPFQIDYLLKSKKVLYIPDAFYHYCLNEGSLTGTFNVGKIDRMFTLYHLLKSKTKDIEGVNIRIDRFIIEYSRARVQDVIMSNIKEKRKWITHICKRLQQTGVYERYPVKAIRIDRRIVYGFMRKNQYILILFTCYLMELSKKIKGVRLK